MKQGRPIFDTMPIADMTSSPTSLPPTPSTSSAFTLALLSLTQDITALISLSLEATASLVHDWFRGTLGTVGLGELVPHSSKPIVEPDHVRLHGGHGSAVVVVGASEGERSRDFDSTEPAVLGQLHADHQNTATGQSLTLYLAKSGYTVFPLVPLPSSHSPPTSIALSSLLLTWSGIQKRLRARHPSHPGAVVPVITDPENSTDYKWSPTKADLKGKGRFAHAGETVRAYCKENGLELVAIVCAARSPHRPSASRDDSPRSPQSKTKWDMITGTTTPRSQYPASLPSAIRSLSIPPSLTISIPRSIHHSSLAMTDEQTLISLYRTNVLDPLSVIRELSDLLSTCAGRGRVVFVNGGKGVEVDEEEGGLLPGATRMVGAARSEAARLLRGELGGVGIDVCEVVVGQFD